MLKGVFDKAETECRIDISFNHNAAGQQQNDCRDLLISYTKNRRMDAGRRIALRLQTVTTHKSGLGLLFLMAASENARYKLVLSRFPADQGILAEPRRDALTVEFLEKVFMKSATAYKSAAYAGRSSASDFWRGRAIDKQINLPGDYVANYWIRDFLASEFSTTPAAGTKRLAVALRTAMSKASNIRAKGEIAAAVTLSGSVAGTTTSIDDFCARLGLSPETVDEVRKVVKHDSLMRELFQFDETEFARHISFRSLELDNGGILTAEATRFDDVFQREAVDQVNSEVRFTTQGRIVNQKLRKAKV